MAGFSVFTSFTAQDKGVTSTLNKFENGLKSLNSQFSKFTDIAGIAGGLSLGYAVSEGARSVMDFDKALSMAGSKLVDLNDENARTSDIFQKLKQAAIETGSTTMFSSAEAAEGLNFLAMAGFNAEDSISALPAVANLAAATATDLATATDIATDSLGALAPALAGIEGKQAKLNRINDVFAKTTTTSNTTMELMMETVKTAGPVFTQAGGSLADFAAITGKLADSGIKGERAGTALKNMVVNLQAPTSKMQQVMDRMNVSIDNGKGTMKPMIQIIGEMSEATKNWTDIERNAAFATLFGKEALSGATIAFAEGEQKLTEFSKALDNSEGTTQKMANFLKGGLSGGLAQMKSALDGIAISIGEAFAPEIEKAILYVKDIATSTKKWVVNNKPLIKDLFRAGQFVISFIAVLKILTPVIYAVNAAMTANPVGLIVAGIVLLITAIALLIVDWDKWSGAYDDFFDNAGAWQLLLAPLNMIWELIKGIVGVFDAFKTDGFVAGMKQIGQTILSWIFFPLEKVLQIASSFGVGESMFKELQDFRKELEFKPVNVENPESAKQQAEISRSEQIKKEQQSIDLNINTNGANATLTNKTTGKTQTGSTLQAAF